MGSDKRPDLGDSFAGGRRPGERLSSDGDDDVEGHRAALRASEGDDVEGHRANPALRGEGASRPTMRATEGEDDDVEGHRANPALRGEGAAGKQLRGEGAGSRQLRAIDGDDDVEGHASTKLR